MGFPKQEYWSELPFPSHGDLPNLGIEPASPALLADSLPTEPAESRSITSVNLNVLPFYVCTCMAMDHSVGCFTLPLISLGAVPHHHLALSVKEFTYSSNS